jgi:DNA-binding IclR family transcriptional regulator
VFSGITGKGGTAVTTLSNGQTTRNSSVTLERGADVLLLFASSEAPKLGVTQIANELGLSKAVVHRILSALRNKGIVEFDPVSHRYSLGPIIMSLGLTYLKKLDVRKIAVPELVSLSKLTNETATLSVRTGASRVYVDQVTPDREVLMSVQIGVPYPLHAGASSKAFLASLPDEEIDRYLSEPLRKVTPATVTDRRKLRRELEQIANRGWAHSFGERQAGASSVAAPVLDYRDYPIAVVSVCGPSDRMESEIDVCAEHLVAAVNRMSLKMGHTLGSDGLRTAP